ncbi:AbrB family transcriptional regulator [Actinotalea sp. M2MS4P-6]|uniref:AbrB family transcriptional regulator n=1 Tax=Actinotalea sp. M2MS4P-6 TaxID=2983762 RepID=UPI0021E4D535|nr:AbrB family transcriptional regulator [Actinotalea sp. M2MS4P-6]MCV2393172.1 AbrB family transcriptional regulator [Actinotalea sp. M2MS4P-6]
MAHADLRRRLLAWVVLGALVAVASLALGAVGLPSPVLFGALLAGLGYALVARDVPALPSRVFTAAQAVLGVAIGTSFDSATLQTLGSSWAAVLLISLATLALSVGAGLLLRLHPAVSAATGTFALIAGGASGIVAMARDLGADERVVAVVQYLRVLIILAGIPLVVQVVFHGQATGATTAAAAAVPWSDLLLAAVCVVVGLVLQRFLPIPAGALLWPLAAVIGLALAGHSIQVPGWLQAGGFALIGLQVGLRFTRESLRTVASVLPLAVLLIVALIALSALLGVALARMTGVTVLDGYLATTPGGLYAVLAAAVGTGSDVTFVLGVQLVRLLVMLGAAPLLARTLRPRAESH